MKPKALILLWGMPAYLEAIGEGLRRAGLEVTFMARTGSGWGGKAMKLLQEERPEWLITWQRFFGATGEAVARTAGEVGVKTIYCDFGVWPHYKSVIFDPKGENAQSELANMKRDEHLEATEAALPELRSMRTDIAAAAGKAARRKEELGLTGLPPQFALLTLQRNDIVLMLDGELRYENHLQVARRTVEAFQARSDAFVAVKTHPQGKALPLPEDDNSHAQIARVEGSDNKEQLAWLIENCTHLITVNSTTWTWAAVCQKPVAALGKGWYTGNGVIHESPSIEDAAQVPVAYPKRAQHFLACMLSRQILADRLNEPEELMAMFRRLHKPDQKAPYVRTDQDRIVAHHGERQAASRLGGITETHCKRYETVTANLPLGARVVDAACGCGYGSWILAHSDHCVAVSGIDINLAAVRYAEQHYAYPKIAYECGDVTNFEVYDADVVVALELIEHVEEPLELLRRFAKWLRPHGALWLSTPNPDVVGPASKYRWHIRHYTKAELEDMLAEAGFTRLQWHADKGHFLCCEKGE
jgi:2-polyprenyl-3-methyl-5-hydroxy-6-metoxy-1,4-benzoquinol methylase